MDLKNIIAAIALSAAVIVLYGLFFAPSQKQVTEETIERNVENFSQNSDVPSLGDNVEIKSVSREDAINSNERVFFENEFIKGSISLKGGVIDDLELKTYDKSLGSNEKIKLLNPEGTDQGYSFNTGWATKSDMEMPRADTIWSVEGAKKLTENNPVKLYHVNIN